MSSGFIVHSFQVSLARLNFLDMSLLSALDIASLSRSICKTESPLSLDDLLCQYILPFND